MRGQNVAQTRRARGLRETQTSAETLVWSKLRNRGLNGFKFVRQFPICQYFVDFCCREAMLIVEIDGATHSTDDEISYDTHRSAAVAAEGYEIIRFQNAEVYNNLNDVLETILAKLENRDTL